MVQIEFDNSYARLPEVFYTKQNPANVAAPELIAFNAPLAAELGITGAQDDADLASFLAGNRMPDGAEPLAQLYAGHQFGTFNPQLGDGRALLLGEVITPKGARYDVQLKGSGPTPYSRRGDGRAALGPVLREYIVSEAMAAMGVPTTRALAAVRTGEDVYRERPLPGAVLTRVASSHIRVGTFQIFAARRDTDALEALYEYTRARHYPEAGSAVELLQDVVTRQANLVAHWLSLGFIHGVMNTDNCTLSGETIDYGPCAFMDVFHANQVFSSIDHMRRYAYSAQADIIVWNMAQLATSLLTMMPDPDAALPEMQAVIEGMGDQIRTAWLKRFAAKIGIAAPEPEDAKLITTLLTAMQDGKSDFTNTFRGLIDGSARDHFADPSFYDAWHGDWQDRLASEGGAEAIMAASNPALIPRNHQIEAVIQAAEGGNDAPFHRLRAALASPFTLAPEFADLSHAPLPDQRISATFCGT